MKLINGEACFQIDLAPRSQVIIILTARPRLEDIRDSATMRQMPTNANANANLMHTAPTLAKQQESRKKQEHHIRDYEYQ